ncbi:hypothetical protein [Mycobacterium florentinum]|uniref:hypothetical protein n=1 Tax=Mycobacterium florentinum TaxID=292462 RepID=UPI000A15EB69|nr:hypothetical protein [Mycobacterium florentinum]MCV7412413.1 hypothetical protein [Mycobacterium florentinum]BBX81795.1 hypothetical protein MFLOJ_55820 [Mycobacterium florentinum]
MAPRLVGGHWLGPGGAGIATHPPLRSLGIRDGVIGWVTIRTADDPPVGARVVALGAAGDMVDCLGTLIAHRGDERVRPVYAAAAAVAAAASIVLACKLHRQNLPNSPPASGAAATNYGAAPKATVDASVSRGLE